MKTLNIIGAGKLGQTLGYLFQHKNCFQVQCILNKTQASAKAACDFIRAGEAVAEFVNLRAADVYLLSVSDDQISSVCEQLVAEHTIPQNSIVFHCSGALAARQLMAAKQVGAYLASAHPVFSFSMPNLAINNLLGAVCTLEGDNQACQILSSAFADIGMQTVEIAEDNKLLYHAALVIASNYLVTLMAGSIAGLQHAGISNEVAQQMLRPLVINTITQIFTLGPLSALTGPLARGDCQLVAQELQALASQDPSLGLLYKELGRYTVNLLRQQGGVLAPEVLALMEESLLVN